MSSPYPGINAHLNSFLLQPDGGWEMFHAAHIIQLQQVLDEILPPNYYAAPEKSLQIASNEPNAVNIYRFDAGEIPGRLVTRLELLSPSNKPRGSHYRNYLRRRRETLRAGVNMIEIDYLHHTTPILPDIPSYIGREANATPYYSTGQ